MLYNIITEGREKEENYKAAIQFHLAQILIRSNRYAQQTYIPKQDRNYKSDQAITQVILYINKYHTEFINLDMLADKFYISKAHLSRTFKKVTGQTIIQYLNFCRVRTAKNLLRKSIFQFLKLVHELAIIAFRTLAGSSNQLLALLLPNFATFL